MNVARIPINIGRTSAEPAPDSNKLGPGFGQVWVEFGSMELDFGRRWPGVR